MSEPGGDAAPANTRTAMRLPAPASPPGRDPVFRGNQWKLSAAQLFAGIGTATGFAVGGILAEQLTGGAQYAGFAQTASILGAGLLAIPLARLAHRTSRRTALSLGFGIAVLGALLILLGTGAGGPLAFFAGMLLFGAATATGFQSRYAAMDAAAPSERARAMSVVVWATTVGSVAGPNLADLGGRLGRPLGLGEYAGPFLVSGVAFALAVLCVALLRTPEREPTDAGATGAEPAAADVHPAGPAGSGIARADADRCDAAAPRVDRPDAGRTGALRTVLAHPGAVRGLVTVVIGQMIMVAVMVMTPVHMHAHGASIRLVGVVISLHVLGMYALSPVMGLLADRFGTGRVIALGFVLFAGAIGTGLADGLGTSDDLRVALALTLLGLGWSAFFIAGSALLTSSVPASARVGVQGLTDACVNIGAAVFAAAAGPLLAVGGFALINAVAAGILLTGIAVTILSASRRRTVGRP